MAMQTVGDNAAPGGRRRCRVWPGCRRHCTSPAADARSPSSSAASILADGRPARHRRIPPRHRSDRVDDARHHRRRVRRRRRVPVRPAGPDAGRAGVPRVVRRRQRTERAQRARRHGRRDRAIRRPRSGRRLPAAAGLADPAVSTSSSTASSPRTSTRRCRCSPRSWLGLPPSAVSAAGTGWCARSSATSDCGACSPSRRSTPGFRRSGRWRCTRSSPTWTPSPACTSRAAGCGRCPTRWPRPPPTPVSNSVTGQTFQRSSAAGSQVTAVHTGNGERIPADAVVLTTELPDTYRLLGRTPRRLLPLRPAPSAVVAHVGCRAVRRRHRPPHHPFR